MTTKPMAPPVNLTAYQQKGDDLSPAEIWAAAVEILAQKLARVDFETWVQPTRLLTYAGGTFTAACVNRFGRDWLNENAVPVMQSFLTELTGSPVRVSFVVNDSSDPFKLEIKQPPVIPACTAAARIRLLAPERVVRFPLYLLHWLPYVGARVVFIAAGLWQEFYLAGGDPRKGGEKVISTRAERICRWAGVSRAQFFRLTQPGSGLEWLVEKQGSGYLMEPESGKMKKLANRYRLHDTPLTPGDAQQLRDYLTEQGIEAFPAAALNAAIAAERGEVFAQPFSRPPAGWEKHPAAPRTVENVIEDLLARSLTAEEAQLAGQLADRLQQKSKFQRVSWYFLTNWLPLLGPEAGMFIILMRSQCYFNDESGEARDEVWVKGGYREIAAKLGISDHREVSYWFPDVFNKGRRKAQLTKASSREISRRKSMQELMGHFIERVDLCAGPRGRCGWKFRVRREDPLTPADQALLEAVERLITRADEGGVLGELQAWSRAFEEKNILQKASTQLVEMRLQDLTRDCSETLKRPLMDCFETVYRPGDDCCETRKPSNQDCGETLLKILKIFKDTFIDIDNHQDSCSAGTLKPGGGFPDFSLGKLLSRADKQVQKELLALEEDSWPLISWLVYACAQPNITGPLGFAIAKLRAFPRVGAGGAASRLAGLPWVELAHLVQEAVGLSPPAHADWEMLFGQARHARLRLLADLLCLDVKEESTLDLLYG